MKFFESRLSAALGQGKAGKIFLAAVSGGADSTALLAALAALRREAGFDLYCVHVEHGLRPAEESRGDAEAVKALCGKLELPCRLISIAPGKIAACAGSGGPGIEGAARYFRMRALHREARRIGADWILTAHTRDDLLETILMRILRGSGPAGLAVMPRTRGRIMRPMLDLTRQDVLAYLEEQGLSYRTDSTNSDTRYLRNRIRLQLIPFLDDFYPAWRKTLFALAETQALAARFLETETKKRLPWSSSTEETEPEGAPLLKLPEGDFINAPDIVREEAVFIGADLLAALNSAKGAGALYNKAPRRTVIRRAADAISGAEHLQTAGMQIPGDLGPVRLQRQNGFITLAATAPRQGGRGFSLLITEAGSYSLGGKVFGLSGRSGLSIRVTNSGAGNNQSPLPVLRSVRLPVVFRSHEEGDRIFKAGHARSFSDILDKDSRSRYTGIITAEDSEGPFAFIGVGRAGHLNVIPRDAVQTGASQAGTAALFEVSLETRFTGGTDV